MICGSHIACCADMRGSIGSACVARSGMRCRGSRVSKVTVAVAPAALLLLGSSLAPAAAGASTEPAGAIDCTSQYELFTAFTFIKGVCCDQLGETCPLGAQLPSTCRVPACAHAVNVVANGCLPWLAQKAQAWLQSFAQQLSSAKKSCHAVSPTPGTIVLSNYTEYEVPNACDREVAGGKLEHQETWLDVVTLVAPKPFVLQLTIHSLWLPSGDSVSVFDGDYTSNHMMVHMKGTTKPTQAIYSLSGMMYLRLLTNKAGSVESFSATVVCGCRSDSACGAHGSCVKGICSCIGGYTGYACTDSTCVGIDCGSHGKCDGKSGKATCVCEKGWSGAKCNANPQHAQCAEPYKTISDDWRSVSHDDKGPGGKVAGDVPVGSLCDDNMKPTGIGGGNWYRFKGNAGDALPTRPLVFSTAAQMAVAG